MSISAEEIVAWGQRPVTRHPGLADEVYEAVLARLMALKIAPGERITVDNLVRELGVSQTPVREALGRLEGEGLVTRTHLVGYRAAPQISQQGFEELYELRLLLEPAAAGRAARRMEADDFARLAEMAAAMARPEGDDARLRYSAFARQDEQFHDAIMLLAGNELIRRTLAHQHAHFFIFRLMFHSSVTEDALREHAALLAAFSARDGDAAQHAMRVHIERSRDRLRPAFA